MATNRKYVQSQVFQLNGAGVSQGDSSMTISNFNQIDGTALTMSDFGTKGYGTCQPGAGVYEEQISWTGVVVNGNGTSTLTGIKTVATVNPYTETSNFAQGHAGGTAFVISNTAGFYGDFTNKYNDETVTGAWTIPNTSDSGSSQSATADDIANAITGTSGTATNLVFGTVKLSVAAASAPNPIAVGDNDTRVPPVDTSTMTAGRVAALAGDNTDIAVGAGNLYVTQTGLQNNAEKYAVDTSGSTTAYVITLSPAPTSLTTGMHIYAKIVNANTTATPTLNANGLGAKTIVKGVSTALSPGDIAANMFCDFVYDGTNLVLQNPVATASTNPYLGLYKSTTSSKNSADASTTQNIAHGLGVVPKYAKLTFRYASTSSATNMTIFAAYDGTTTSVIAHYVASGAYNVDNSLRLNALGNSNSYNAGVITWDATNVIITWTLTGTPSGTYQILLETQA